MLESSVLREALLGDVQFRQNLDSGQERNAQPVGKQQMVAQDAVHAQPHAHFARACFDVDVACAQLRRIGQKLVAQFDGGSRIA